MHPIEWIGNKFSSVFNGLAEMDVLPHKCGVDCFESDLFFMNSPFTNLRQCLFSALVSTNNELLQSRKIVVDGSIERVPIRCRHISLFLILKYFARTMPPARVRTQHQIDCGVAANWQESNANVYSYWIKYVSHNVFIRRLNSLETVIKKKKHSAVWAVSCILCLCVFYFDGLVHRFYVIEIFLAFILRTQIFCSVFRFGGILWFHFSCCLAVALFT